MTIVYIVVIAAALLVVLGLVAGNILCSIALKRQSNKGLVLGADHNEIHYDEAATARRREAQDWFDAADKEWIEQTSADGLTLRACIVRQEASANWVVTCHGYMGSIQDMVNAAYEFHKRGYQVLMPDARGCGSRGGAYMGMGWPERLDLVRWLRRINDEFSPRNIVLYGVSMGGATVMMTSGEALPENVRAIVEDCGYTSVYDEFAYQLKALFKLPPFPTMQFGSLMARLRAGFWLGEASAMAQVAKSKTPTLFIHGAADTFVPAWMGRKAYEAASCEKQLLIVEGAGHGQSAYTDWDMYWGTIDPFLEEYLK